VIYGKLQSRTTGQKASFDNEAVVAESQSINPTSTVSGVRPFDDEPVQVAVRFLLQFSTGFGPLLLCLLPGAEPQAPYHPWDLNFGNQQEVQTDKTLPVTMRLQRKLRPCSAK
jgi:hypothetical protein